MTKKKLYFAPPTCEEFSFSFQGSLLAGSDWGALGEAGSQLDINDDPFGGDLVL